MFNWRGTTVLLKFPNNIEHSVFADSVKNELARETAENMVHMGCELAKNPGDERSEEIYRALVCACDDLLGRAGATEEILGIRAYSGVYVRISDIADILGYVTGKIIKGYEACLPEDNGSV